MRYKAIFVLNWMQDRNDFEAPGKTITPLLINLAEKYSEGTSPVIELHQLLQGTFL